MTPDIVQSPARARFLRFARRFITGLHILLAAGFANGSVRRMLSPTGVTDSDFTVFRSAWWLILHGRGGSLYDPAAQQSAQHQLMGGRQFEGGLMAFLNPPHAALAGVPLGWIADRMGANVAFALWALVNVLLLFRLVHLACDMLQARRGEPGWTVTIAILAFYPVFYTISIGQLSLLLAVALFELLRAIERRRTYTAAAWLLVLSVKPQLLPPLILLLAARQGWPILRSAAAMGFAAAAMAIACLGKGIWFDYVRGLHALEQFFAAGTPASMMNLRGALTRLLPASASGDSVYVASVAAWAAALVMLAALLVARRRTATATGFRGEFAMSVAVALFFNPHLFPQDTVMWIVALVVFVQASRDGGRRWLPFAAFALCWPIVFTVARALDVAGPSPVRVTPVFLAMLAALIAIVRANLDLTAPARFPTETVPARPAPRP